MNLKKLTAKAFKRISPQASSLRTRARIMPANLPKLMPNLTGQLPAQALDLWRKDRVIAMTLLVMLADLILAPCVWAASGGALSFSASIWVVLLGIATVGLSIYLFYVMFKPEAF